MVVDSSTAFNLEDHLEAINYLLSEEITSVCTKTFCARTHARTNMYCYSVYLTCALVLKCTLLLIENSVQLMQEVSSDVQLALETQEHLNQVQLFCNIFINLCMENCTDCEAFCNSCHSFNGF